MVHARERQRPARRTDRRPPAIAGTGIDRPRPRPALTADILELQRLAGNQATSSLVTSVQRYDTGEHAQMGSDRAVVVNGVTFTQKEMTAMADLFGTVEDMQKAPAWRLLRLKFLIGQQTAWYQSGGKRGSDVSHEQWDVATGGQYLKLAEDNETHFAPGRLSAGKDHRTSWQDHHRRALLIARAAAVVAGASSVPVPAEARLVNDFGNHFLTDAFSVGHLIAKRDLMEASRKSFESLSSTDGWVFTQNVFTDRVAAMVMANPTVSAEFGKRLLKLVEFAPIDAERLSEFLYQMSDKRPEMFYSLFAKLIHDRMNRSILGGHATAIEVENDRGDVWDLPGDITLDRSPKTLAIINQAMQQADLNLEEAAASPDLSDALTKFGGKDDFVLRIPELFDRVWSYAPRLTSRGQRTADVMVKEGTDAAGLPAARQFADIIIQQLPTVIAQLTDAGYLMEKEEMRRREIEVLPGY